MNRYEQEIRDLVALLREVVQQYASQSPKTPGWYYHGCLSTMEGVFYTLVEHGHAEEDGAWLKLKDWNDVTWKFFEPATSAPSAPESDASAPRDSSPPGGPIPPTSPPSPESSSSATP